jgi:putative FmdB family regulatory protein
MPLFDFECKTCGASFEELVRNVSHSAGVNCEKCGSGEVERKIASFHAASSSSISASLPTGGGGCGAGSCGCH